MAFLYKISAIWNSTFFLKFTWPQRRGKLPSIGMYALSIFTKKGQSTLKLISFTHTLDNVTRSHHTILLAEFYRRKENQRKLVLKHHLCFYSKSNYWEQAHGVTPCLKMPSMSWNKSSVSKHKYVLWIKISVKTIYKKYIYIRYISYGQISLFIHKFAYEEFVSYIFMYV